MGNTGKRRHTVWLILVFFAMTTLFFSMMIAATMPKYKAVSSPEEIAATDLSEDYICLGEQNAEVYPGRLYDSADFAAGNVSPGDPEAKYQTCRVVLSLEAGKTYGMTGQTATYAQRVYVNGELRNETGSVADNAGQFTPRTDLYTVYFTPQSGKTEIIVQHAWFNHRTGAFHKVFLAEQPVITRMERAKTLCEGVITGVLLGMTIFFLGMFLFNPSNRGMLWFSLSCLCAAANDLIYESKQIMTIFPHLNWYVGHKIELLTNVYYFLFIALFAFSMLHCRTKRWFRALSFSLLGAVTAFYIFAPSTFYTHYTVPLGAAMMLYELFTVIVLLRIAAGEGKLRRPDNLIVCLSPLLVLLVYAVEGATYFSHILYLRAYAMILLAFCNALVLTISYSRTERRLHEARTRELEIAEENAMLEKMNSLKSDFMRNIAHEMKTPLTVMSGYAQLTQRQIQKDAVNEETTANLQTIAREAGRLSDMVTRLLDVTYQGMGASAPVCFPPQELLDDAAAVCRPVLQKNENRLELVCRSRKKLVANKESLLQVLINLTINAGKHTKGGKIVFRAEDGEAPGVVVFSVSDNGSGISEADLPHIFECGYGTDGGNGLGLTICRDIIESMGGTIAVEKTDKTGTTIRFTVPSGEEEAI